jgi:hypothetical protein
MVLNDLKQPVLPWKPLTPNKGRIDFDGNFNPGIWGKYAAGGALGLYGAAQYGQGIWNLISLLRLAAL